MGDDRERNKDVIHRFYEAVNSKHREFFQQIVRKDFVNHGGAAGDIEGPDALIDSLDPFYAAMPDWHVSEDVVLAEGDRVASRGTITGTHEGAFMGIPATNKAVAWTGIIIYRLEDGQVVERWQDFDALGMLQQMGVVPAMGDVPEPTGADTRIPLGGDEGTAETARQLSRRYVEILNARDYDALDGVLSADYVDHDPLPLQGPGVAGLKDALRMLDAGFSDLRFSLEDVVAEGDMVIARGAYDGTHDGEFIVPATNNKMHWTATRMFRVAGDKLVEGWQNLDMIGLLTQLGLVPPQSA